MKLLLLGFIFGGVIGFIFGSSGSVPGYDLGDSSRSPQAPSNRRDSGSDGSYTSRLGASTSRAAIGEVKSVDLLERLYEINSKMESYLYFPILSGAELLLSPSDLEVLGLTQERGEHFQKEMQSIVEEIRKRETESFEVLEHSDDNVVISIEPLQEAEAQIFRDKIHSCYSKILPTSIARGTASRFIESNPNFLGGIIGRNRLVQVLPAGENDVLPGGDRPRYRVRSVVLGENMEHNYYDKKGLDPFFEMAGRDSLVEKLPEAWTHLFESK